MNLKTRLILQAANGIIFTCLYFALKKTEYGSFIFAIIGILSLLNAISLFHKNKKEKEIH